MNSMIWFKKKKKNKLEPKYVCSRMALEQGFVIVRLPPYHCIFNPINLIWAWIKQEVANKTFKIAVLTLTNKAISAVTLDQWRDAFQDCRKLVDDFFC